MGTNPPRVLVAGAAGAIGEGICAAFLDAACLVVALDRDAEGLRRLSAEIDHEGRLSTHVVELCDSAAVQATIAGVFEQEPRASAVVACLGRWWEGGALCEQDYPAELHGVMQSSLLPHLVLARHTIPRLRGSEGARYLFINGGTADLPEPGRGLLNLSAAAQRMLALVLAAEEEGLEVATLQLSGPVRSRKLREDREDWMDARGVGEACRRLLASSRDIDGKCYRARDNASLSRTP